MDRQPRRLEPRSVSDAEEGAASPIYAPGSLAEGIRTLTVEPLFAEIVERAGPPRFRRRRNGFGTLLHIILEQQVSIDAAAAMHKRLLGLCRPLAPEAFLALDDSTLRSCGFSRQKMGYARDLAARVGSGKLDFAWLDAAEDEAALAELLSLRGIGRWSAEVYLLFALGRADIWPAADLGLQVALGDHLRSGARPDERETRRLGEAWRPWRSVATCLFWQSYLQARGRTAPRLPLELYA
jgi:DNA-3-methyladenine glycosylase II